MRRSFNIRFRGSIETCFNADDVIIDNDSVTLYIGSEMIFYVSLVDVVYVKEFKFENSLGSFETLYS